jgi:hypothetical protein
LLVALCTEEANVRTAISSSLQDGVSKADGEVLVVSEQLREETVDDVRCLSRRLKLGAIVLPVLMAAMVMRLGVASLTYLFVKEERKQLLSFSLFTSTIAGSRKPKAASKKGERALDVGRRHSPTGTARTSRLAKN